MPLQFSNNYIFSSKFYDFIHFKLSGFKETGGNMEE